MKVAIPKERIVGEARVAATPETVRTLKAMGLEVMVETGAGEASLMGNGDYAKAGAQIVSSTPELYGSADIVLKVRHPSQPKGSPASGGSAGGGENHEADLLRKNTLLLALLNPYRNLELLEKLNARQVTALALEMVPRIARAQKIDALSSQSNIAGYKAVLMAANTLQKMMPLMMTAAGTVKPAKVFVIGAGVAGLQAIATAKRLGAQVEAFDTRPVVKEQVESLGAKFVSFDLEGEGAEAAGGYAKELSADAHRREQEFLSRHVTAADIVITTALIPGKPAPRLVTEAMVRGMKPGSVIVDLAAEGGGNCELTVAGREATAHGVQILGHVNVPSLVAWQASQLYARNITGLLSEICKEGKIDLDLKNEVIRGALITRDGQTVSEPIRRAMAAKGT